MSSESGRTIDRLFRLDGKNIVVTGAAGLLGKRHVFAIAAYGGTPILVDIHKSAAQDIAEEINAKYQVGAVGLGVDITNESQIATSANYIEETFIHLDGLVNNAANNPKMEDAQGGDFSRLESLPIETWDRDLAVGLTGAYLCSKHYGGLIAKNSSGGSIVNISSDLGLIAPDQRLYREDDRSQDDASVKPVTYSVIKAGLLGLTRYLSTYWIDKNVRCNAICPGGIENNQPEVFLSRVSSRIPMNRLAKPDEYQGTLVWMLSDASSYLNGAIVPVDGGRTAW